ncbi:AzlC family ABC transporter permease [Streptomyces sp. NPDC046862]|uniref:AzlC family ABC transporter permease n=1 Tax=Streptomyces sp. NPDC046862 TaxID=3154603 RepID=UPI003453EB79
MQREALTRSAAPAPADRRMRMAQGVRDSFSAGLGIFPLGIALGLLILQAGLPWWLTPALSLAAFAGSPELLLVGRMATVTPLAAVLAIVFTITLALRAVPFAVLGRLRDSAIVGQLSVWMPVGILAILAVSALHGTITADRHGASYALLATAVTVGVHLAFGRRTILSISISIGIGIGIGTGVYVVLLNAF